MCALLFLWLKVGAALAHGPFDHSSRLVVGAERMELAVTLGADATREFLVRAQAASRFSSASAELPVELAGKFFSVRADGVALAAEKLIARTDGLETTFTISYPRPAAGELELRAFFFNGIEPMKGGPFVAADEKQKPLARAILLSRAENVVTLALPTGGPGDPPVPSGHRPDGTGAGLVSETAHQDVATLAAVPGGGSPPGPGRWPVLPIAAVTVAIGFLLAVGWRRFGAPSIARPESASPKSKPSDARRSAANRVVTWFFLVAFSFALTSPVHAQRQMERLARGVIAVRANSTQVYVGWRLLGNDPSEVAFNLYRAANGGAPVKLNTLPLTNTTDYLDTPGGLSTTSYAYSVRPVFNNVEVPDTFAHPSNAPFVLPTNAPTRQYIPVPLQATPDGAHRVKFCWVGDLDGDGEYDFVVNRDNDNVSGQRQFVEAYRRNGTLLWRMNMGYNSTDHYNIEPGSSTIGIGHGDNLTVYDLDGDGRAEVIVRTANGVVFANGVTVTAGANDNVQFLSILNGLTGVEMARATIPNPFLADGPIQGHMAIFYPDGQRPSVLLSAKNRRDSSGGDNGFQGLVTVWDYRHSALTQRWSWNDQNYHAPEGHQIRVGDPDHDGRDEFMDIGYALNDNGTPLFNLPGVTHGDRFHITDIDPERAGLETFIIQQNNSSGLATALFDAGTGAYIKRWYAGGVVDVGRGVAGDFSAARKGYEMFSTQPNTYDAKGDVLYADHPFPPEAIWWDADVLREFCETVGSSAESPAIAKFDIASPDSNIRLFTIYNEPSAPTGSYWAFGGRPPHHGDLFGDWREEVIVVADDHSELRIYTTRNVATNRLYTLQHNAQYRVQQTAKGYVQASYVDYYLGDGMTPPPPAPFSNARLVWRGGGANNWDAGATANWFTNNLWVSNNTPVVFGNGDSVLFDLTGSNHTAINLTGALTPGAVTVYSPKDFTFGGSGSLGGAMKLTKVGAGKLTLSGTNNFTGATLIAEGALVVNGALPSSPVTVRGGVWLDGRLGGRGTVGAAVTLEPGAGLSPGAGTNAPATLALASHLTLRGLTLNDFDLSDDASGATKTDDLVNVAGNVTLQGTNTFVIRKLNATLPPGVYPLINYSGTLTGSVSSLRVSGLEGLPVTFTNPPGQIALVVRATRAPTTLTWTGGLNGHAWDLFTTSNWLNGVSKDVFVPLDTVRFDNTGASNLNAVLTGSLLASNVVVNSTSNYVLSGSGAIIGGASLLKSNSGTLTISALNNMFTGRTVVGGGTLVVPELDAVGFPSPLGNPGSSPTNLVLAGSATLRVTGESYTDRGLTLSAGTNALDVTNAADQLTFAAPLVGAGALRKLGAGQLALSASNSFTSGTIIDAGRISLIGSGGNRYGLGAGLVTISNGRLSFMDLQDNYTYAQAFLVPAGGTARIDCDGRSVMTGALTGGGALSVWTPYVRTDFRGDWSAFTGQINVITDSDGGTFRVGHSAGFPLARLHLADEVSLQNRVSSGTPTISIGELSGAAGCNASGGSGDDGLDVNWSVGGLNTSATFAGNTFNNIGFIKVGTGTWTMSGTNLTHSGQTTVNGGTLLMNGNASNALGAVTVGAAGTLGGTGLVGGNTTVNGRLAPGSNGIGTLAFRGNVTFNAAGVARMEIQKSSGTRDLASVGGALSYNGTLSVTNLGGALTNGDSFKIFNATTYAGTFTNFDLPALAPGLFWDTGPLDLNGTLRITTNDLRPQTLVRAGSVWKFHDLGTDLGTSWRGTNYNDSAWPGGPAMLGFGDANGLLPATTITNRSQVTFYFRQSFVVTNLASVTNLALRLLRDDGAVVHLNSNEVWRSNMPTGAVTSATRAAATVANAEESQWFTTNVMPTFLRLGTNVLAVEIHQVTNTSSDVAFDFEMIAESASENTPPTVTLSSPSEGAEFFTPGGIALSAGASDADGLIARVDFFADGALVGSVSSAPFNFTWNNPAPGLHTLLAVAYDNAGASGVSAPVNISVTARFIAAGSVWKFHDLGTDLGTAWRATNYNDAAWATGPAELGFGDDDEATVISNRSQITFYFRQTFTVPNPASITNLALRLVRDDGAVVYLNGSEVVRSNMPAGTVLFTTRALTAIGNADESAWFTNALNPALLVAGLNTLAVEIHQVTNTSSDVSFNLELTARASGMPLVPPELAIQLTLTNATLSWPQTPTPFRLEATATLSPTDWQPWPGPVTTNAGALIAPVPPTNAARFFRLRWP